jgi:ribosome recycling factor
MIEEVLADLHSQMHATVDSFKRDLAKIRTGRANPSLLDSVRVDYYGSETPLNKLATVSVPDAQLLVVQPFDLGAIAQIDKAIRSADLGLSPVNDGKILRVPIPTLTAERRKEFVKLLWKEAEKHKVSCRNHRRDANELLKELHDEKEITDDDMRKAQESVQKVTDETTKKIDEIGKTKEAELLAV